MVLQINYKSDMFRTSFNGGVSCKFPMDGIKAKVVFGTTPMSAGAWRHILKQFVNGVKRNVLPVNIVAKMRGNLIFAHGIAKCCGKQVGRTILISSGLSLRRVSLLTITKGAAVIRLAIIFFASLAEQGNLNIALWWKNSWAGNFGAQRLFTTSMEIKPITA